jgi:hypothetical protein
MLLTETGKLFDLITSRMITKAKVSSLVHGPVDISNLPSDKYSTPLHLLYDSGWLRFLLTGVTVFVSGTSTGPFGWLSWHLFPHEKHLH